VSHLSEGQVFDILAKVKSVNLEPYQDEDISKPLVAGELKGKVIIKEKKLKDFNAVEWTLGNNAKVVYRYSDLEKNNITMSAFSPGGTSLYPANMLESAGLVTYLMPWYGLGDFDAIALQKKLKGKNVSLTPVFGGNECNEGFRGSSTPEDFETLLQLLYLYFEKPRFDRKAFDNIIKRNLEAAASRYNDPANIINDSVILILNDYHERTKLSGTRDYYLRADFSEVEKIYRDRMKDAGDFTFFFVGNISQDSAKLLVEKYIGSIKDDPRKEKWIDNGVRWPEGKIFKEIPVNMKEPKTTVLVNFNRSLKYNPYNIMVLDIISRILQITYTETIREKEGGTYGVYCDGSLKHYPASEASFLIFFDCKPENAEKLSGIVSEEIEKLRSGGPSAENLTKALLAMRKEREEALKRNAFWSSALYSYYYDKVNNVSSKNFEGILDRLDTRDIQKFSDKFFSGSDQVEIRFVPQAE